MLPLGKVVQPIREDDIAVTPRGETCQEWRVGGIKRKNVYELGRFSVSLCLEQHSFSNKTIQGSEERHHITHTTILAHKFDLKTRKPPATAVQESHPVPAK
ncbi:hypothetical protein E2C01_027352 [Portunus trituberculatus]|uniref:Uncharacterized protein n=1 Tax=Portunus trituberculatus TaxID=210409 RepID=A0A5B7EII2_PORTR|nr:hypothetical protein [Portunus trituberculatus]